MSDNEKLTIELFYRGWSSKEILAKTGLTPRKVGLTSDKRLFDKETFVEQELMYLRKHYSEQEIKNALISLLQYSSADRKKMKVLDSYFPHFQMLGVLVFGDTFVDMVNKSMRKQLEKSLMKKYGVASPNANPESAKKMIATLKKTNQKRYGVDFSAQRPDVASKINKSRQKTMRQKYGVANSVSDPVLRHKILEARRKHGNITESRVEQALGAMLRKVFGRADVVSQFYDPDRYPFYCDFYIPSRDLFIELNGDKGHGGHWYDNDNPDDVEIAKIWQAKAILCEKDKPDKFKSRYRNYLKMWTKTDPEKRVTAKKNQLNYLVFWDVAYKPKAIVNDAQAWIDAGCPDPRDWKPENTY